MGVIREFLGGGGLTTIGFRLTGGHRCSYETEECILCVQ